MTQLFSDTTVPAGSPDLADAGRAEWYRAPQQERSQETLDAFLDSIDGLLAERPYDDITVHEIVERAGRTIGSFYARFRDKDAALYTLHARNLELDTALSAELLDPCRWQGTCLEGAVRAVMTVLVQAYRRPRASFRAAIVRSADSPELLEACRLASLQTAAAWRRLVEESIETGCGRDLEQAADRCFRYALAVLNQDLLWGELVSPEALTDEELVSELTEGCLALLPDPVAG